MRNSNAKNNSSSQCWIFKIFDAFEDNLDILDILDVDNLEQGSLFLTMLDFVFLDCSSQCWISISYTWSLIWLFWVVTQKEIKSAEAWRWNLTILPHNVGFYGSFAKFFLTTLVGSQWLPTNVVRKNENWVIQHCKEAYILSTNVVRILPRNSSSQCFSS